MTGGARRIAPGPSAVLGQPSAQASADACLDTEQLPAFNADMQPAYSGIAHLALTVADVERSKEWYGRVLGWHEVMDGDDAGTRLAVGVLAGGVLLGLREPPDRSGDRFDYRRTGLDHLSLAVASPEELARWEQRFAELRVTYSSTVAGPIGHVLSFKDPDGIALELFAAAPAQAERVDT